MANIVRFGAYEVDLPAGQLCKHGIKIGLRDQSFQVLAALLEHPGQVVTREELRQRLWRSEVFVDFDNNLNTAIGRLREALGDSAEHPRFIETLPKRGYRFLENVLEPPALDKATAKRGRLVVLPFLNLSGHPAQEYFSDAITDAVITALAGLVPEQLAVIARTTAMHYKGSHKDVSRIGRELGVDYAVEGGVRQSECRIAINVQLIRTSDQAHVFAKQYDAEMHDVFSLHTAIAEDIARHIPGVSSTLRVGDHVRRKPTKDLVAYRLYLQGRAEMDKGMPETNAKAKQYFDQAIAHDPEFAPAYDALAEISWYSGYIGLVSPRQAFSTGIVHALRAIEIDNTRAETHALLGQFHKIAEYNWGEVEREMALALRLDPNSPLVRMRYAVSGLMPHGRVEEAVSELERALELDPLSFLARMWLGIMLVLGGHYERGIEEGRKLLALDANYWPAHFVIACCYRCQKKFDEALAVQRRAVELSGGAAFQLGWFGLELAESGNTAGARDVLRRLHGMATQGYVPPSSFAWIHLGLGEVDTCFDWLNRAVDECDQFMMPIKTYDFLDPIRSDPRFALLLRKMHLEA
jgi:TolB-like protein/Tfp pilus assembly protein PilF